jgi:UDP:flavonoid glycosyltransferase YjiC (YdhE family)
MLPEGVVAVDYAPFSELFPRAAVIVHHGGIGTTGLAMRSGRPMLVRGRGTSRTTPSVPPGWA